MFVVAESRSIKLTEEYGKHLASTDDDDDDDDDGRGTWYPPQACKFLKLDHHIHSFVHKNDKSIFIKSTIRISKIELGNVLMDIYNVEKKEV